MRYLAVCAVAAMLIAAGCNESATDDAGQPIDWVVPPAPVPTTTDVTLAAGMTEIAPDATDNLSSRVSLSRFGASAFDRVYTLDTPAGDEFSFTLVARGLGNFGLTQISLGHVADNGVTPWQGIESMIAAGMMLDAQGMSHDNNLVHIVGDGFARVTIRGKIQGTQVLAAQVPRGWDLPLVIGIEVRIGPSSIINMPNVNAPPSKPGISNTPIFSSDSWLFGLPAIAVSGDRYSVVTYDGGLPTEYDAYRQRRWLQLNGTTGAVTGGAAECASVDSGSWRDQEIAARGNVLGIIYTAQGQVRIDISLDRGGSFPIQRILADQNGWGTQRLVQINIGEDYRIGCLYWSCTASGSTATSRLRLIEGTPTGFDLNNTPIDYAWSAPVTIHNPGGDVTPLLMHMEYSAAGDLVVGYGYTLMTFDFFNVLSSARYRCAVRLQGQTSFTDIELDREDNVMPADPHVAVMGTGANMEVFYTYEKSDGIYLMYSADAGGSWQHAAHVPVPGALQPSVFARDKNGLKRVDLLYLSPVALGLELHNVVWDSFVAGTPGMVHRLTTATSSPSTLTPPPGCPQGTMVRTMAWFGYDAVLDGDKVAIATHEMNIDSYEWWGVGAPMFGRPGLVAMAGGDASGSFFAPPPPRVLLPGLTDPVAAPDPAHRSLLSVIVID